MRRRANFVPGNRAKSNGASAQNRPEVPVFALYVTCAVRAKSCQARCDFRAISPLVTAQKSNKYGRF
jgi:hypothetical protein